MFRKSTLAFATLLAFGASAAAPVSSAFADDSQVSVTPATAVAAQGKGQAAMQSVLDDLMQGKTDLEQIQPMSRVNLLQQPGMLASLSTRLQSFGGLQSVAYAGVQNGMEIYDVRFASASMVFATAVAPDGKIARINWKFH